MGRRAAVVRDSIRGECRGESTGMPPAPPPPGQSLPQRMTRRRAVSLREHFAALAVRRCSWRCSTEGRCPSCQARPHAMADPNISSVQPPSPVAILFFGTCNLTADAATCSRGGGDSGEQGAAEHHRQARARLRTAGPGKTCGAPAYGSPPSDDCRVAAHHCRSVPDFLKGLNDAYMR